MCAHAYNTYIYTRMHTYKYACMNCEIKHTHAHTHTYTHTHAHTHTQMHLAAYRGHPDVVKLMLEKNADPTVGNGCVCTCT